MQLAPICNTWICGMNFLGAFVRPEGKTKFWNWQQISLLFSDWPLRICQIQQQLEVQKKKLEELEAEHLETGRSMKDFPVDTEEQTSIIEKYHSEQQELEHQRHVLEDLEFQMFEVNIVLFSLLNSFSVYWLPNIDTYPNTQKLYEIIFELRPVQYRQYSLDNKRCYVIQVDVHYEEQKELIQQQLVTEQQMISDVDSVYSVSL